MLAVRVEGVAWAAPPGANASNESGAATRRAAVPANRRKERLIKLSYLPGDRMRLCEVHWYRRPVVARFPAGLRSCVPSARVPGWHRGRSAGPVNGDAEVLAGRLTQPAVEGP